MILLKLNWTSCSRSKRCINNWSSELWHAKSSNFTFCEEKKHFFERENIKRIKNKEGKNGRDVNHKEKPKESLSLSFFFVDTHSPCELEQLVIHKIKGRAAALCWRFLQITLWAKQISWNFHTKLHGFFIYMPLQTVKWWVCWFY